MMLSMGDAVQAYSLTMGEQARLKDIVNIFESCRYDEYGCFSNFAHYGFELDGKWWMTSEHYFQAQKFYGTQFIIF